IHDQSPLAVRTLEALSPVHFDGTPPETEAIQLRQQPITAHREQALPKFFHSHHARNSCYPVGQAVYPPEAPIG
ncbi:hypothetical protein TNCV_596401, partial [Trichonephila clavipes]